MIRHGHYERTGNLGDEVWGLSPLGRRQAARTARRLSKVVEPYRGSFEGIYSSPWPRALQTAEIAAHELEQHTVWVKPYLHECAALVPEDDERCRKLGLQPTPGPLVKAAEEAVGKIRSRFLVPSRKDCTYVLSIHGNLIRYLVTTSIGLPMSSWMYMEIHHASITELRVYPGNVIALIRYNDTGHLPPNMVTS